ncbi:MAG: hypothetical protein JW849_05850, partial [Phycisphaerae bacterium]|nr:hypothetical protein [Phycisphaerae bacterium]
MSGKSKLDLSPSVFHRRLMKAKPALSFDGGDLKTWRRRLRKKIAELTGFDAMPRPNERCKLNAQTLWTREHKHGRIEKIAFRAEPGADVVGYVCLPKKASPPY